jgi:hypothetical protein
MATPVAFSLYDECSSNYKLTCKHFSGPFCVQFTLENIPSMLHLLSTSQFRLVAMFDTINLYKNISDNL